MSWLEDLILGEDPSYEWEGTYSKEELAKMFAALPQGEMPSTGGLQALLAKLFDFEKGYRHPLQKELLGGLDPIPQQYEKAAGANAAQLYGAQGQEFEQYAGARGQDVNADIKRDILAKAEENKTKASRKIGVTGKGMGLDVLGRKAAGVGGFPRQTQMANMMAQKLGFETDLEQQKFMNEMNMLQFSNPAPQQVYNPGSPGLLPSLLPSLLMNALPGLGNLFGSSTNPSPTMGNPSITNPYATRYGGY